MPFIHIPASKSISNRLLIMNALADADAPIENLSDCNDTRRLRAILQSDGNRFDVGNAGTVMRFLTAFLARTVGRWEIDGSERMRHRPVAPLVEALNRLGAHIEYTGNHGFPPLRIYGSHLKGGGVEMDGSASSQFATALLLIAPYTDEGVQLSLTGQVTSRSYIDMTIALQRRFGAEITTDGNRISVRPGAYRPVPFCVEADWTSASYFYEWMSVVGGGSVMLPGLLRDSVQGDARQCGLWYSLGVGTEFTAEGIMLIKKAVQTPAIFRADFSSMPDLVPSFAVSCCLKGIPFRMEGVETLRLKECDRLDALSTELRKLGYVLNISGDSSVLAWDGTTCAAEVHPHINPHGDHRMAMAFAAATPNRSNLAIDDKEVVSKSFPAFWEELASVTQNLVTSPS